MAPLESLITPLGWEFINSLPPVLREDPDYRAIMHCGAKEAELIEGKIEYVRRQFNPLTADADGLRLWEQILRLPTGSPDLNVRRTVVVERWRSLSGDPAGSSWVTRLSGRFGTSAWLYAEHVAGDPSTPPPQTLQIHLPALPGTPAWDRMLLAAREETPSELALTFITMEGFLLDQDQLDIDELNI